MSDIMTEFDIAEPGYIGYVCDPWFPRHARNPESVIKSLCGQTLGTGVDGVRFGFVTLKAPLDCVACADRVSEVDI